MTYLMQQYNDCRTALVSKTSWLKKLLGFSFAFFLLKGLVWLGIFSVVIIKGLF